MIGKNNPFNIRYSANNHWVGQLSPVRGFCSFREMRFGLRAAVILVCRHYMCDLCMNNISRIVSRFAPRQENDTDSYVHYVCERVFPNEDWKLSRYNALRAAGRSSEDTVVLVSRMLRYMSCYEGNPVPVDDITPIVKKVLYDS